MRFFKLYTKKIISCCNLLIVTGIIFFPSMSQEAENPLLSYLEQKALTNYSKSLEMLEEWTLNEKDPVVIETNIFRINELAKFSDLTDKAIAAYKRILQNEVINNNPDLKVRAVIFLNLLYLRLGRTQEASSAINNLGFIKQYKIIGPFKNTDKEHSLSFIPEAGKNGKDLYDKKTWFDVSVDLSGKIDAGDLFHAPGNFVFFLKSTVTVPSNGKYIFHLGKTGYTNIWIDGKNVFSNKKKHEFSFDQYRIEVPLSKGRHELLIRTGDSLCGAKLALRLTDKIGNAMLQSNPELVDKNESVDNESRTAFFRSLDYALQNNPAHKQHFDIGYLYYASGLNSEEAKEASSFFSKVKDSAYVPLANYYLGLLEKEDVEKNFYFNESIGVNKLNIEALSETVNIKIKNNFLYEAFPLVEAIKEINNQSSLIHKLKAMAFLKLGWDFEALKEASRQKESDLKSSGYEIEAEIYYRKKQYKEALNVYKYLYEADRNNIEYLTKLVECCIKTGRYDEAESFFSQSAELYPNNIMLRLKHAGLIEKIKGPGPALPYLLSARKISPYHKDVLLNTGLAYYKLNNDELALQFMRAALQHDPNEPDKLWIKTYIEIISEKSKNKTAGKLKKNDFIEQTEKKETSASRLTANENLNADNFILLEREVLKSKYSGSKDLFNKIENLLQKFPAEPESLLYYRELANLSGTYGCERTAQTLRKLLNSLSNINFPQKNLFLLSIKLELEKLLYCCNIQEAKKLSKELHPVNKWLLSGPFLKYGIKDMDYPFLPELTTNFKSPNIKKKEIIIEYTDGVLDLGKYLYPEKGIGYALSTINIDKPIKIKIYSSNSYKIFINGKEAIKNQKGDIFRTCRIVKVWNTAGITLMIKSVLNDKRNDLRVLITDENDNILNLNADTSRFVFSECNFIEEPDYPYSLFSDAALSGNSNINDPNYKLARYFHELESDEAIKLYRRAVAGAKTDDPHIRLKLAASLLEQSGRDSESYTNPEGWSIIVKLAENNPDFMPAQEMKLKGLADSDNLNEAFYKAVKIYKNKNLSSFSFRFKYAALLLKSGYEKEFEKEIETLIKNFPDSILPLRLLAEYYKNRNVVKAIEIHKRILSKEHSENSIKELINIYKEQGSYDEIKALLIQYDYRARFRKELIESLIASGNFIEAKKAIFYELAKKNDPLYNKWLGNISYYEGLEPAMYWQKALSISPSDFSLNDFLEYLETDKIENPFKQYADKSINKDIQYKDILKEIQKNPPSGLINLKKNMVFLLNEDGGSRLFCEDVILLSSSKGSKDKNNPEFYKHNEYKIPFKGEVIPVNIRILNNKEKLSDFFSLKKKNGENYISIPLVKEDSIIYLSYYINNPVKNPKGSNFFTLPETSIEFNESLSAINLKVITPKDIKVRFSFNKETGIKSETLSDRNIYNAFINKKRPESKEDINLSQNDFFKFSFSTMTDMKEFILWCNGQAHGKFNIHDDSIKSLFAGKDSGDIIKSIYYYVSRQIQLKSNGLFSSQKAMDTYYIKSGTAEDKAILAASILAELGIRAYIAFAGEQGEQSSQGSQDSFDNDSFASPDSITNILLFVPLDVKEGVWMDFSDTQNKFGKVHEKLTGKNAVVIIKDGYEVKKISANQLQ